MGQRGIVHVQVVPTVVNATSPYPLDRVNHPFNAERPNPLWVTDFTDVSTGQGFVYIAFVIDGFARYIVGGQGQSVDAHQFRPCALEQALYTRQLAHGEALIHHSDQGLQ